MSSYSTEKSITFRSFYTRRVRDKSPKSLFKFSLHKILVTALTGSYEFKVYAPSTLPGINSKQYFYRIKIDYRETTKKLRSAVSKLPPILQKEVERAAFETLTLNKFRFYISEQIFREYFDTNLGTERNSSRLDCDGSIPQGCGMLFSFILKK